MAKPPDHVRRETASLVVYSRERLMGEALASLLAATGDFAVAGTAADDVALVTLVDEIEPDVVVVNAPGGSRGAHLLVRALHRPRRATKVVVLIDEADAETVRRALSAGTHAILERSSSAQEIVMAVKQVMAGHAVMPLAWRSAIAVHAPATRAGSLSPRQVEVLRLIAGGLSNSEIAAALFLSVNTVKFHVRTIFRELGIRNRVEAAQRWAELADALEAMPAAPPAGIDPRGGLPPAWMAEKTMLPDD